MNLMDKIVALTKRRGFIYQSTEIYGGFAAVYDYGPYGVELKNNIKKLWWENMVQKRGNIVGLDSAIFMSPKVWEASGHVGGFSDPLIEYKKTNERIRVDHLLQSAGVPADEKMEEEELQKLFDENFESLNLPSDDPDDYTPVRRFNLLVKTNLGNVTEDDSEDPVFLRGETAQGIYVNYKNVLDTTRVKVPFGIAQIGKAFRNEITARQFIFRTREFEQMEMQYFVRPEHEMKEYENLKDIRHQFYIDQGIEKENLRITKHENLVFYAKEAHDIEYKFPFGFGEVEGVHARGDYDLSQHTNHSNEDLTYKDPESGEEFIPHVVESSSGVDRNVLMWLAEGYTEEETERGERVVMKFNKRIAPVKAAVFPLLRNKPKLVEMAQEIYQELSGEFMCEFDDHGNIGKRYRRQDEIGTPFCITVDFDSLDDRTVTVRDRDSMKQERVSASQLVDYLSEKLS